VVGVSFAPLPNESGGYGGEPVGVSAGVRCLGVGCRAHGLEPTGIGLLLVFLDTGGLLLSCHLV
jgi:hypothetical protein